MLAWAGLVMGFLALAIALMLPGEISRGGDDRAFLDALAPAYTRAKRDERAIIALSAQPSFATGRVENKPIVRTWLAGLIAMQNESAGAIPCSADMKSVKRAVSDVAVTARKSEALRVYAASLPLGGAHDRASREWEASLEKIDAKNEELQNLMVRTAEARILGEGG